MKKTNSLLRLIAVVPMMVLSTSAYANYNVTVTDTGGRAVYAVYPVHNGYNNSNGFVAGHMNLLVTGRGTISFSDISGAPCSPWAVGITYGTDVYTYYYNGGGQLIISLDANGNLSLNTPNGTIVPKPPGQCS
ncbi:hypothetical protein JQX13_03815 [Archangium violaceum]|uniref:hypothetical protein n=1 Tax=Archangium violaceum TaxID=83451 RepID=UPI00193B0843|nr:hypothetical protein [Archangium violaceum]QRK09291.1 hypothetical protein JQX13_03815 [Archangium violaceum]